MTASDEGTTRRSPSPAPSSTAHGPSDDELMGRLGEGDHDALTLLYGRWARPSYSLALQICRDEDLAEAVVQDVFLAVWTEPTRFNSAQTLFGTCLLTLVHRNAVNLVRREGVRRRHSLVDGADCPEWSVPPGPGVDKAAARSLVGTQVRAALGRLPTEQRRAVTLAYYRGYTQQEIAGILGVPVGTVRSRMFAGMRRLWVLVGRSLSEPAPGGASAVE